MTSPGRWPLLLALWVAAAAYFAIGLTQGMDPVDEGHLVYLSWRVAEGAVPYRTFEHWYGPSVFFLNGLLFRLAGPDLLFVRVALLVTRAGMAVLVFVLTRRLAGTGPGLLAYAVTVVTVGLPLFIFLAPYAGNYQLPLTLLALALYLGAPRAGRARLLAAGACLGLGATFKPAGGVLAFVGFALFLLARERPQDAALTTQPAAPRLPWGAPRAGGILVGLAVLAVYGASMGTVWHVVLLLMPILLLAARALAGGWGAAPHDRARNVPDVLVSASGFAIAPGAYALWYAGHGALDALARATLFGLPQRFALVVPFPTPDRRTLMVLGLAAASLVALRCSRAAGGRAVTAGRAVVAAAVAVAGALVVALVGPTGPRGYLVTGVWARDVLHLAFWLPPAVAWASCLSAARLRPSAGSDPVLVLTFVAAASLPLVAPVADWAHVLAILPLFLPLAVHGLAALAPDRGRLRSAALLVAWLAIAPPCIRILLQSRWNTPPSAVALPRATFAIERRRTAPDLLALIGYLATARRDDERVLTIPSNGMLQFLSGRVSALEEDDFWLYAATVGPQVSAGDARALLDEADAIRRVDDRKPLVVREAGAPGADRFREVFPTLSRHIDERYRRVATFGPYEVLEWTARDDLLAR